jgi:uncharacterized protein (DUF58 family)
VTLTLTRAVPDADRAVRALELAVTRRLDGLLQGDHLGRLPGPGWEPNDARLYQPGDDVRRIDWNVTARANGVHVRNTVADRELETWVVVDGSASLDFGTDQWQKRDLATAAVATFGFLSCHGGSRFGLVVADGDGARVHPPRSGRDHVRRLVRELANRPPAGTGAADLASALDRVRRSGRHPGVVVLVSDLLGEHAWVRPLRAHAERSRTIAVEVRDRREDELPAVGLLTLVDPETGAIREMPTGKPALRARFAAAAAVRRAEAHQAARRAGAEHLVLTTNRDWLTDIARFHLTSRRHP